MGLRIIPEVCRLQTFCRACNGSMHRRRQEQVCWEHVRGISLPGHPPPFKSPQPWKAPVGDCAICGELLQGRLWTAIHAECVNVVAMGELL